MKHISALAVLVLLLGAAAAYGQSTDSGVKPANAGPSAPIGSTARTMAPAIGAANAIPDVQGRDSAIVNPVGSAAGEPKRHKPSAKAAKGKASSPSSSDPGGSPQ
jgi:hypothetical protein